MGRDAAGKKQYVTFLKRRYGDGIDQLNEAYGLELDSFDDLSDHRFGQIQLGHWRVIEDDRAFLGQIAEQFYAVIGPAFRKYAPNHDTNSGKVV